MKQDIQPLIRLYCIPCFLCFFPCSHIGTRYAHHMAQRQHLLWWEEGVILKRWHWSCQERYCTCEHYFHFRLFIATETEDGLCPNNRAITVCQISNPTHPQQRQNASKRPQSSCCGWVAVLTLLSALRRSPGALRGWIWGNEVYLQLAMSMRTGNMKGAVGGDGARVIDRTGAGHCWKFCLKGRWRMWL